MPSPRGALAGWLGSGAAPGIVFCMAVAGAAYAASYIHESFDPLVSSIILGILAANLIERRGLLQEGAGVCLRVFLPIGFGLYALRLAGAPGGVVLYGSVVLASVSAFALTYFICRGFGISDGLSTLLATGISVCGAAAIAAISTMTRARRSERSIAIISVMAIGLAGMITYRMMPGILGLGTREFAVMTGVTLPMFGQIEVAARGIGQAGIDYALGVKAMRMTTLLLVWALLAYRDRALKDRGRGAGMPWYLMAFAIVWAVASGVEIPVGALGVLETIGTLSLTMAMASISATMDFDSITELGGGPLYAAALSWGIFVLSIFLVLSVLV